MDDVADIRWRWGHFPLYVSGVCVLHHTKVTVMEAVTLFMVGKL